MITAAHTHCFVCGSTALLNLARTLNGGESTNSMPGAFTAVANISAGRTPSREAMSGEDHGGHFGSAASACLFLKVRRNNIRRTKVQDNHAPTNP